LSWVGESVGPRLGFGPGFDEEEIFLPAPPYVLLAPPYKI